MWYSFCDENPDVIIEYVKEISDCFIKPHSFVVSIQHIKHYIIYNNNKF